MRDSKSTEGHWMEAINDNFYHPRRSIWTPIVHNEVVNFLKSQLLQASKLCDLDWFKSGTLKD